MNCCGGLDFPRPSLPPRRPTSSWCCMRFPAGRWPKRSSTRPCRARAENMIMLLDSLPPAVAALAASPAVDRRGRNVRGNDRRRAAGAGPAAAVAGRPDLRRSRRAATRHRAHPRRLPRGSALRRPTGLITGVLDIDTIGPGRRADDLACMIAHLSTMQRMTAEQAASLTRLINLWLQVFDTRVDPAELRLRAAGVIVSLATGPVPGPGTAGAGVR